MKQNLNFKAINLALLKCINSLLPQWLPNGRMEGKEYVVLNPTRNDNHLGSFRINVKTGKWADFAQDNAKGGDIISLYAYLHNLSQTEAAITLAKISGGRHG